MYNGYNKIFWGILIMTVNFKFGSLKILPAFVGLFIISSGINALHEETKLESFHKVHVIGILTAILSFIGEAVGLITEGFLGNSILISIWMVAYAAIELVLFYKVMESSIEYMDSNNYSELADEYSRKQRTYAFISITNTVLTNFALMYNVSLLLGVVPIVGIILRIYLLVMFNRLKKLFIVDCGFKEK